MGISIFCGPKKKGSQTCIPVAVTNPYNLCNLLVIIASIQQSKNTHIKLEIAVKNIKCVYISQKKNPSRLSTISHVYTRREIKNTTAKPIHGQKKRAEINEKTLNYSRFKFTFFFSLYTISPKKKAMESYGSIYTAVVPTVNSTD